MILFLKIVLRICNAGTKQKKEAEGILGPAGAVLEALLLPDCRTRCSVCWTRTSDLGTMMMKSTLLKWPRSRLWLPLSAMAHTWDKSFLATVSCG